MLTDYLPTVNSTDFLVSILAVGIVLALYQWFNDRKLPPGPIGLPFVGYLPFLTDKPYLKLQELKRKYGPVFSLRLGSELVVFLTDYESMKEAFSKDVFIGRPIDSTLELTEETKKTGAFTHLPWKEQRNFSLHLLRDLGLGKSTIEANLKDEIEEVLDTLGKEGGKAIHPNRFLSPSVSNNIASLVFGQRREYNDPKRMMLDRVLKSAGRLAQTVTFLMFFPYLKAIARFLHFSQQHELSNAFDDMKKYIREEMVAHRKTLDENHIRDYMDGYLLQIEKTKGNPKSSFKDDVLVDMVSTFFGAGSETVRIAVEWLLLVLAEYPDIQKKVQSEIDEVIGSERFPSKSDSPNMPFCEAVIMEVLRWRATLPINLPRCTIEDTELNSYLIPKNTQVLAVIWAVHHDPEVWGEDVECFKPERFLSEDGKQTRKPAQYMPFSIGKRSCPGESFALMEVFMYLAAIFQKFDVSLPKGAKADFEGILGIGLQPKPFEVCFTRRQ